MAVQLASGALKSRVDGTNQWQDAIIAVRLSDVAVQASEPTSTEKIWFDTNDAEETLVPEMSDHLTLAGASAIVVNGKQSAVAAVENDYVILQNSDISGKDDGLYLANKAIPANTDLDGTYLKTDSSLAKDGLNALSSFFENLLESRVGKNANAKIHTLVGGISGTPANKISCITTPCDNVGYFCWVRHYSSSGYVGALYLIDSNSNYPNRFTKILDSEDLISDIRRISNTEIEVTLSSNQTHVYIAGVFIGRIN